MDNGSVPGEAVASFFATNFRVHASIPSHFIVECGIEILQGGQPGATVTRPIGRVYLSPVGAKVLAEQLQRTISDYERKMGTIEVPNGPDWRPPMER